MAEMQTKKLSEIKMMTNKQVVDFFCIQKLRENFEESGQKLYPNDKTAYNEHMRKMLDVISCIATRDQVAEMCEISQNMKKIDTLVLDRPLEEKYQLCMCNLMKNCKKVEIYDQYILKKMGNEKLKGHYRMSFTDIEEIFLGKDISRIPSDTFKFYKQLKTISGGENVRKIGDEAFLGCENLENFECTKAKHVGNRIFAGCEKLQSLEFHNAGIAFEKRNGDFDKIQGIEESEHNRDFEGFEEFEEFEESDVIFQERESTNTISATESDDILSLGNSDGEALQGWEISCDSDCQREQTKREELFESKNKKTLAQKKANAAKRPKYNGFDKV